MKQKDIFLESEGNAWFARNARALAARALPDEDPLLMALLALPREAERPRLLEIGCGEGIRLQWLRDHSGFECVGLDPSADAVAAARARGLDARQGTADQLPFDDGAFSIVLYGFCLYLCDREDLFQIAREADRVLTNPGWLLILDFYSPVPQRREYHHRAGLFSYKMDYRTLFTWHPGYVCLSQEVRDHVAGAYTDEPQEWVATSVIRKHVDRAR